VTRQRLERIPVREILHDVGGSYRHRFGRVVVAAAIVFGITAVIGAAVEDLLNKSQENFVVYIFALAGTTMSQVGITFYAGLLDKVVGEYELGEEPEPVLHVLRHLPYGSLIAADVIITAVTAIGMVFLIVPGVIVFTLFAITGPIVNIEQRGAISAMKRSARLVRTHFWLVLFLVSIPLAIEHQAIHLSHELVFGHALVEVFIVQGITGMIVGSFVGLVEVNVAYALVQQDRARVPSPTA
jgi:hypothetical protein